MMKTFQSLLILLVSIAPSSALFCQSRLVGNWEGRLDIGMRTVKLILHVSPDGESFKSVLDSPDQGAVNLPIERTRIAADSLEVSDPKMGITIRGCYRAEGDSIDAHLLQFGRSIPITLGRSSVTGFILNRPQTPKPPFPYTSEEVVFANAKADNIKLAGTLTKPKDSKILCTAILVSGSGPQNRNEKAVNHEPFLILSDYLSRNGVAVLRFDDRGTAQSEGDFSSATSFDFSTDVEAALDYLRKRNDIPIDRIGLIGHSEGGMIAPMVAARRNDVAFVVCLAGIGVPVDKLMLKQIEEFSRSTKEPDSARQAQLKLNAEVFARIKTMEQHNQLESRIRAIAKKYHYPGEDTVSQNQFARRTTSPWFTYFIRYDPAKTLEHVRCPFLALNGTLDKQVDATMNLEGMRSALNKGNNRDCTLMYLPGLNHGFQEATTGDVSEYTLIEQTMSPKALDAVSQWLHKEF